MKKKKYQDQAKIFKKAKRNTVIRPKLEVIASLCLELKQPTVSFLLWHHFLSFSQVSRGNQLQLLSEMEGRELPLSKQ